ncbi:MAG: hypothetical protein ACXWWD_05435 [Chitinophagaceae bacterium]
MHKKRITGYQTNIYSAALFALAILVLVVSCPLKRLFINNHVSQTSVASKFNRTNNNQYFSILYSSHTTYCADKNKTPILQADKSQHTKVVAPAFTINIFNHTGYCIHSFLDGIKTDHNSAPDSGYSSLPLFLRHRSLLI